MYNDNKLSKLRSANSQVTNGPNELKMLIDKRTFTEILNRLQERSNAIYFTKAMAEECLSQAGQLTLTGEHNGYYNKKVIKCLETLLNERERKNEWNDTIVT